MTDREFLGKMYFLLQREPRATVICDQLEDMLAERLAQPREWQDIPDNTLEELLGLHCSTSGYMSEADAREFATDLGSRLKEKNA